MQSGDLNDLDSLLNILVGDLWEITNGVTDDNCGYQSEYRRTDRGWPAEQNQANGQDDRQHT